MIWLGIDFTFLTKPVFWSAIGVLIALATLFNLKSRPLRFWRLQRLLNRERRFYESFPASPPPPESDSEEGRESAYIAAVEDGVAAIEGLSPAERRAAATNLVELIGTLQATHATLVEALQPFSEMEVKTFLADWSAVQGKLQTAYFGGQIPSDAHTHSSRVRSLVWELTSSQTGQRSTSLERLRKLGDSVVTQDKEVIIPVMRSVLDRCQTEVGLISMALRDRDVRRAIRIKEKYWFDVKRSCLRMQHALQKMRVLGNEFSRLSV
jgi:hypothetical protein